MRRVGFILVCCIVAVPVGAAPRNSGGIPELDYGSTCRETPPVAMDRQQTLTSCLNDEKQAKADLPKQWSRSKQEWKSSCLRQTTLGGLPSYVELITCLEMHDPNPPSLNRPGMTAPSSGPPSAVVGTSPAPGNPAIAPAK